MLKNKNIKFTSTKSIYAFKLLETFDVAEFKALSEFFNYLSWESDHTEKVQRALVNSYTKNKLAAPSTNHSTIPQEHIINEVFTAVTDSKNSIPSPSERKELIKIVREQIYPKIKLFLAFQELSKEENELQYLFLKNNLHSFNKERFSTFFQLEQKRIGQANLPDSGKFSHQYRIEELKMYYDYHLGKDDQRFNLSTLKNLNAVQYACNMLELLITEVSLYDVNASNKNIDVELSRLKKFIKDHDLKHHDYISCLFDFVFIYNKSIQEKSVDGLKKQLTKLNKLLANKQYAKIDKSRFYLIVINLIKTQIYRGEDLYQDLFSIYAILDKDNKLIDSSAINVLRLKSILTAACKADQLNWAKRIYEKYKKHIAKEDQEIAHQFFDVFFLFYSEDYEAAFNAIENIESLNSSLSADYEISSRMIKLKSLFEIPFEARFWNIVKTQRQFFNDCKYISSEQRSYYLTFIKLYEGLLKLKHQNNIDAVRGEANKKLRIHKAKISKQLALKDVICDKLWISEKLAEI